MEVLQAHTFREVLRVIEEAKQLDPEATKAALGLTGAEPEVSDGDD